ncbi:MAG: hypothetical protein IT210_01420 [Armatimonadetes bacterium]|nr:hypothetical protein [Armatimonadota bacterium]
MRLPLSLAVGFMAACLPASPPDQSDIGLSNGKMRVCFDPANGGLREIGSPESLPAVTGGPPGLWKLAVVSSSGPGEITPAQARSFRSERLGKRGIKLIWSDFRAEDAGSLTVTCEVSLRPGEPASDWRLRADGLGTLRLQEVFYPILPAIARHPEERLAVPLWMGQLSRNPRHLLRGNRLQFDYPGLTSMQCMAWYAEGGPGLYLACDDARAYRKSFILEGGPDGQVGAWLSHLPESGSGQSCYALPYRVSVRLFQGDWFTAAEMYRAWAVRQAWAKKSRLRSGAVPGWARSTALWVWNRGRSGEVLPPAEILQEKLGLPVSVFWHWWHGCAYDAGFPEYLPPREGADSFKAALQGAHRNGVHALIYMNQRLWSMTAGSWKSEGAERFAVKNRKGEITPEVYNAFTRTPCASMCIHTAFWRSKYASLAEGALRELGADGIYMDQACSSLACYDPAHGHPAGGGTYWMEGFRKLSADIRRRLYPRKSALAGEGVGESWLPHLDLMLSLEVSRERYAGPDGWEPIPFFQAVYHPYVIQYGSYSSLTLPPYDNLWPPEFAPEEPLRLLDRKFSRQFFLEQARAFVWGQQLALANFLPDHLRERPEEIGYVLGLARLRHQAMKFLAQGTFLRPPQTDASEAEIDMSRLSIYAGQDGRLTAFRMRTPQVLAGAWRSPDGSIGIALASIADSPLEIRLTLDPAAHRLPHRGRLWRIDSAGRRYAGRFRRGDMALTVALPARGACMIEFEGDRRVK